jgi:hypothetical protein
MHQFFDPSLMPVTTTDLDGNILYVRTNGLYHYGYPDMIVEGGAEDAEQLLLDILDRIFSLTFNVNEIWNHNGRLFRLEIDDNGLAHIVYQESDEVRTITILNPVTGQEAKHQSKGLTKLFNHPEAQVAGDTLYGKEILGYLINQVKEGIVYDQDTLITFENMIYEISYTSDRMGNPVVEIHLQQGSANIPTKAKTQKRLVGASHLRLVK